MSLKASLQLPELHQYHQLPDMIVSSWLKLSHFLPHLCILFSVEIRRVFVQTDWKIVARAILMWFLFLKQQLLVTRVLDKVLGTILAVISFNLHSKGPMRWYLLLHVLQMRYLMLQEVK